MNSPLSLPARRGRLRPAMALAATVAAGMMLVPGPARAHERACHPRVELLPDLGYGGGAVGVQGSTVVGFALDASGGQYPAIWRDGRLTTLSFDPGFAGDINARGEVVGTAVRSTVGFALEDGTVHLLAPHPTHFIYARRINDRGQIAGAAFDGNDAARWDSMTASPTRLGPAPGDAYSFARGINDAGVVAGDSDSATFIQHPAIWSPAGQVRVFASGFGAGDAGDLFAINNAGESAGESFRVDPAGDILFDQATVWSASGSPTLVPLLPGTDQSTALNLNDAGWVVGEAAIGANYATGDPGVVHALLWSGRGPARTLPVPGFPYAASESQVHDVSSAGTAVGQSGPAGGPDTATVWTCAGDQAFVPGDLSSASAARRHHSPSTMRRLFTRRRRMA